METTQENRSSAPVTTRSVGIRFGIIGALISIVYFLVINIAGLDMTQGFWNWLVYVITLAIIFLAHKYYKENGDGFMTYGQGIGIALWIGIVSGTISSVFNYLYIKFVDDSFLQLVSEKQIEVLQEKGFSDEQIDEAMQISSIFLTAEAMLLIMLFNAILMTIIIALIVTIFTQKKHPEPAF